MSGLSALLGKLNKAGVKLTENVGDNLVFKVSEEAQKAYGLGKEITIPKSRIEGGYGKVSLEKPPKEVLGEVLPAEKSTTTLPEILQAKEQGDLLKREAAIQSVDLSKVREKLASKSTITPQEHAALVQSVKDEAYAHDVATKAKDIKELKGDTPLERVLDPEVTQDITNKKPIKEMMEELQKIKKEAKVAGIAAIPASESADMSPLPYIKEGYERYKAAKDALLEKGAEQMDLTKDRSATEDIAGALGLVADPINLIPGAPGIAASALQMGLESKLLNKLRKK